MNTFTQSYYFYPNLLWGKLPMWLKTSYNVVLYLMKTQNINTYMW
jgi:hypothetical protein